MSGLSFGVVLEKVPAGEKRRINERHELVGCTFTLAYLVLLMLMLFDTFSLSMYIQVQVLRIQYLPVPREEEGEGRRRGREPGRRRRRRIGLLSFHPSFLPSSFSSFLPSFVLSFLPVFFSLFPLSLLPSFLPFFFFPLSLPSTWQSATLHHITSHQKSPDFLRFSVDRFTRMRMVFFFFRPDDVIKWQRKGKVRQCLVSLFGSIYPESTARRGRG